MDRNGALGRSGATATSVASAAVSSPMPRIAAAWGNARATLRTPVPSSSAPRSAYVWLRLEPKCDPAITTPAAKMPSVLNARPAVSAGILCLLLPEWVASARLRLQTVQRLCPRRVARPSVRIGDAPVSPARRGFVNISSGTLAARPRVQESPRRHPSGASSWPNAQTSAPRNGGS